MKTYILSVPDDTTDPAVHAALAELLAQQLIVLAPTADSLLQPLLEEEFATKLRGALASPVVSAEQARRYLGL